MTSTVHDARSRHAGAARGRLCVAAVVAMLAPACGDSARTSAAARCATGLQDELVAAAEAQAATLAHCVDRLDEAPARAAIAGCLAEDPLGLRAVVRDRASRIESERCSGPTIGATDAATVVAAGAQLVDAVAHGLFGRDLDAALGSGDASAALCQRRVLTAALACSARSLASYAGCARGRLGVGVQDPFELVACKPLPDGATCDAEVASVLADACPTGTPEPFPGCAGDPVRCTRAHAERAASDAVNRAAGLCRDVLPGTLDRETLLRCFAPPALEPIVYRDVPTPPAAIVSTVQWNEGGDLLVVGFSSPDVTGTQLAALRPDGADFRCLTCGSALDGAGDPVQLFRDGGRVLVAGPNNANPRWSVLECSPSLLDCRDSRLLPIALPANPDPATAILQYRVPWVTLDDGWLIWTEVRLRGPGGNVSAMGRLVRTADRYEIRDARVIAPPPRALAPGDDSALWRALTQPYEAKYGGLRGGRDWIEAGTPDGGQYDDVTIDLATGEVRRITSHPDHDEGVRFTRDEQWAILQSTRLDNRVEFLGVVPRPPYLDWIAFSLHFVAIAGAPTDGVSPGGRAAERDCYADPWILDRWFERGDYVGQPLSKPADGWESIAGNAGGFDWSPDGTRIAFVEQRWRRLFSPGEPRPTRLRIAELPAREPIAPGAFVPIAEIGEPTWATRYEDWIVPNTVGISVVPGRASGTATIVNGFETTLRGSARVEYEGYSDDGESFLEGFEEIRIPTFVRNGAEYAVDLTVRGVHEGRMRGEVVYDFANDVNRGEIVAEVDGRTLVGPKTCFEAGLLPVP